MVTMYNSGQLDNYERDSTIMYSSPLIFNTLKFKRGGRPPKRRATVPEALDIREHHFLIDFAIHAVHN